MALSTAVLFGCVNPVPEDREPTVEPEVPLDLSVDRVDVVHGALRLHATMIDGAADVWTTLGGDCEPRETGGGVSTLSTLVWTLGENELADVLACGLVVHARVIVGPRRVIKAAALTVTPDVVDSRGQGADEGPALQETTSSPAGVTLAFAAASTGGRLLAGGSSIERAEPEIEEGEAPVESDPPARFLVPFDDFARALLLRRALVLDGAAFDPSVSVGGTTLDSWRDGSDDAG
jgi:hypothetical protein